MKLLHLADVHARGERAAEVLQSLRVAQETARAEAVDLIVLAGDTWDRAVLNVAGARFFELVSAIGDLAMIAPVAVIYGTPTHDVEGSLEVLKGLNTYHGITILQPGQKYFLSKEGTISTATPKDPAAIIFGVPEPSKKWLMPMVDNKDDAESAVRGALRGLFAGLGATRRDHANLPAVLIYHGQVAGARLQNGDRLDAGTGLRPAVDDLDLVGADYIAMGDIHEPQRVGEGIGLPAYYCGSAYPVDFGETHDAGCNLATVEVGRHDVRRISFGHPRNQTIRTTVEQDMFSLDVAKHEPIIRGAKVKLEVTCNKDEAPQLDIEHLLARLKFQGAVEGSLVVLNVRPTETVRVGDIAEQKRPRDKVLLWADNSKREVSESVLTKADELEREAESSGVVGHGSRIRIDRLVLRGAIGLWKKSGLDEIDLDFETLPPGLVALIGNNGAGKTTLIENMHPWPQLLTRDGTLKDHFRLRDSFRDLYWTDELTGSKYRAQILINAGTASGSTEYFLYRFEGGAWVPLSGITGRKDDYVSAIDKLFGSMELFLRSAFVTQRQPKNIPDLAEATAGERKTLFSSLCGLEYLEAYKDLAKEKAAQIEAAILTRKAEVSVLEARLPDADAITSKLNELTSELEEASGNLNILSVVEERNSAEVKELTRKQEEQNQIISEGQKIRAEADRLKTNIAGFEFQIKSLEEKIAQKADAERELAEYESLTTALQVENDRYQKHLELVQAEQARIHELRKEHDKAAEESRRQHKLVMEKYEVSVSKARDAERAAEKAVEGGTRTIMVLEEGLKREEAEASKPIKETCDTCGQLLPAESRAKIQADLETKKAKVETRRADLVELNKSLDELKADLAKIKQDRLEVEKDKPVLEESLFITPPSTVPEYDSSELSRLRGVLAFMDAVGAQNIVSEAAHAAGMIEALKLNIGSTTSHLASLEIQIQALRARLNPEISKRLERAQTSLDNARKMHSDVKLNRIRLETEIASAKKEIDRIQDDLKQIKEIEAEIVKQQNEATEWRLLETAFSDKGIQALELDAIAPSISAIANGLLKDAFGSRYQINFRTTRISGSGKTQKQIEDFLIEVLDSETGETQEIRTLSGGESVWIKRALYDSFGIIRARNTNLIFLTAFQDEADGALDPDARVTYFRMLEAAHIQSGRRHTILISHSSEIQEMIQTKIEVTKLSGRKQSSVAA